MPPIIDAHLHVFTRACREFPRQATELCPAEREEPVEKFISLMQEHGIDYAVLVQIGGNEFSQHAYLLHCLDLYPEKFRGIGLVFPGSASPGDDMDRLAETGGIIGFRLGSLGPPEGATRETDIRQLSTYPIWKHAAENNYVLWLYPRAADAHLLPELFRAFPEVNAVFNHLAVMPGPGKFSIDSLGRPRVDTPMPPETSRFSLSLQQYPNVYFMVSGHYAFSRQPFPYPDLKGWHRLLYETYGADRLLWATDFPWILEDPGYGPLTTVIDEQLPGLTEKERQAIMGGTAARLIRSMCGPVLG